MGGGLVAYQLPLGKHADRKDLVLIFDDKDENIVSTENGKIFIRPDCAHLGYNKCYKVIRWLFLEKINMLIIIIVVLRPSNQFFWFADFAYLNFDLNRPFILNLHKVDQPFQDKW